MVQGQFLENNSSWSTQLQLRAITKPGPGLPVDTNQDTCCLETVTHPMPTICVFAWSASYLGVFCHFIQCQTSSICQKKSH